MDPKITEIKESKTFGFDYYTGIEWQPCEKRKNKKNKPICMGEVQLEAWRSELEDASLSLLYSLNYLDFKLVDEPFKNEVSRF